jgi:hypothetical protein
MSSFIICTFQLVLLSAKKEELHFMLRVDVKIDLTQTGVS